MSKYTFISTLFLCVFLHCESKQGTSRSISDIISSATPNNRLNHQDYLFESTDGQRYKLEDFAGQRIFLNFWATWCKPCIAEMPDIVAASDSLKHEGYVFFLISDQSMKEIKKFKTKSGIALPFAQFNGELQDLGLQSIPTTWVYDTKGVKQKTIIGAIDWDREEMLKELKAIQ